MNDTPPTPEPPAIRFTVERQHIQPLDPRDVRIDVSCGGERRGVLGLPPAEADAFVSMVERWPNVEGVLSDILEYGGGADSPMDDEYVMGRATALLTAIRGEGK